MSRRVAKFNKGEKLKNGTGIAINNPNILNMISGMQNQWISLFVAFLWLTA